MAREGYGVNLFRYGRIEEGLGFIAQCLDVLRRVNQSGTHGFANTLLWKAGAETELGHNREAEAALAEVSAIHARLDAPPPDYRSDRAIVSARFLMATGKADQAAQALAEYPLGPAVEGALSYDWLDISLARAEASLARNRPEEAIEQAGAVRRRIEASGLGLYFKRWEAEAALEEGKALLLSRRPLEALPLLQRAVRLGSDVYDPDRSPRLASSEIALAKDLVALDRRAEALAPLARAKAIHATHKDLGEQYRKPLRELEALLRGRH
jgi:tetratricopeptide (TPR) repeat protein